jgi:integrase
LACITKLKNKKGFTYRAYIRRKGLKPISKVFSTRSLAEQFVKRIEGDRELLLAFGGNKEYQIILSELVDMYLGNEYPGKDIRKQTTRLQFWVDRYGHKLISEITRTDISRGVYELSNTLSNATVNRYKSAISVVFSFACRQYELPDNPVLHIPSKPENNTKVRYLSNNERNSLFDACKNSTWDRLYLLVLMAVITGARRSELLGLKWSDLDFDINIAYIGNSKNGQPRALPLTKEVINELSKYIQVSHSLIFCSSVDVNKSFCFTKSWNRALKQANIQDFRFHDLRHTTASYLAQSGASLLEIAEVLGHKQIQVTKRYAHLCINHKTKLINRVLGGITET